MKLRTSLIALCATLVLGACDDSTSSPSTPGTGTVAFGSVAVGTWTGQRGIATYLAAVRDSVRSTLVITNTLREDSSFTGSLQVSKVSLGATGFGDVAGPLYTKSGKWSVVGDSLLLLSSTSCSQAVSETVPLLGLSLPFSISEMTANELASVGCPAPDTIRTRPVGNRWTIPLNVNLPPLDSGLWTVDFVR